jgi:hypothetical protein
MLFKLLCKSRPSIWTDEAFQELKWYLTSSPVMVAPKPEEPLLLYITAMSMILVTERPEPPQSQETKETRAHASRASGSQELKMPWGAEAQRLRGHRDPSWPLEAGTQWRYRARLE